MREEAELWGNLVEDRGTGPAREADTEWDLDWTMMMMEGAWTG